MKKLNLLAGFIFLSVIFSGCLHDDIKGDKEKNVEMKIYPETGYGTPIMSDIWCEQLQFSDNDDNQKRLLIDIITEGFDFDYQKGYEYIIKAKKVWMKEPPQDVSSIKYIFIELVSKKKIITTNSEINIELFVASKTVEFIPNYPKEYEEGGDIKIYKALHVKENGKNDWIALKEIEGFDFENGYEYRLNVKKITQAEPYSVRYVLLGVISKNEKGK